MTARWRSRAQIWMLVIATTTLCVLAAPAHMGSFGSLATLTVVVTDVNWTDVTLDGVDQTNVALASGAWTITDLRLTGAAWSVSISATTPTSAAGTVETSARTIAVSNVTVTTGSVTVQSGDPATNIVGTTNLALSTSPQTLIASSGDSTGVYLITPSFGFAIPANAYRSNYAGAVGSSALEPYTTTISVTIS